MGDPDLNELVRQIRELEARVRSLEQRMDEVPEEPAPAAVHLAAPALGDTARTVTVLGKALLAIAGAYFLRALTEMRAVPLPLGVALAILYALFWLMRAARFAEQRLVAGVHAATSALILVPLLWETTVRFQATSDWAAAGVLTLFSVFGLGVAWRKQLAIVAWMTTLAGVFAAAALLLATHDLAPFTLALLGIGAAVEFSACLDHWLRERWVVALAADLAVLLLSYILTRPRGLPPGYAPIPLALALAAQIGLLVVYLASAIVRTLVEGCTFTSFETVQAIAAFVLCTGGAVAVSRGDPAAVGAVSILSVLGGAACYIVSFAFLERARKRDRNFYTYSTFGLMLVFTGVSLALSGSTLALVLSSLAVLCFAVGRQAGRITLEWHGALYLLLATVLSGLGSWATARLLGSGQQWVAPETPAWISAAAALLGFAFVSRGATVRHRWLGLVAAGNCAWVAGGFAAGALIAVCGTHLAGVGGFCPTFRTAALVALVVIMGWSGRKWNKPELVWLVYPFLVLTAYKLMAQDLLQGETLPLFAALLLYGGTLVLLPRILQKPKPG